MLILAVLLLLAVCLVVLARGAVQQYRDQWQAALAPAVERDDELVEHLRSGLPVAATDERVTRMLAGWRDQVRRRPMPPWTGHDLVTGVES